MNSSSYLGGSSKSTNDNKVYVHKSLQKWIINPVTGENDVYTIQLEFPNSNGFSYLNVAASNKSDENVYLWNKPSDKTCQWIIKPVAGGDGYSIQNVRNAKDSKYAKGYSYLSTKNNNVLLWNKPSDKTCQWVISPIN
jgi:hypothetical protein